MAADKAVELYLEQDKRMAATAAPAILQCVYAVCVWRCVCVRCVCGVYRSVYTARRCRQRRAKLIARIFP